MSDLIDIWVAGTPKGKGRPQFVKATGRAITPKDTVNAEAQVVQAWREKGEPRLPDGPVGMTMVLHVERPAGHFNSKGELNAEGLRNPLPHRRKPDIDNAMKLVCDALNGRAYKDDVQIVEAAQQRRWSDRAGVRVTLYEVKVVI